MSVLGIIRKTGIKLLLLRRKYNRVKEWRTTFAQNTGVQVLTQTQKKEIADYFSDYQKVDPVFHNFYTEKTGEFYVNYLPDDIYYAVIDQFYNNWAHGRYMDNKCAYHHMFTGVAQAENIVWRSNGLWFCGNDILLHEDDVLKMLQEHNSFVLKVATYAYGGHGVFFLEGEDRIESFQKKVHEITDDIVVQKLLVQHEALNRINSSSINTIRALSLLSNDGVKVYSSVLRMGINGARVDNASSGGITCGIDKDGLLKKNAYTASGERYTQHPNSGIVFAGYAVPGFHAMVEKICDLHCQIPNFRMVSWDFSINEQGEPVLVEVNLNAGELDFHQLNNGPIFGEDTKKILDEVYKSKNKNLDSL